MKKYLIFDPAQPGVIWAEFLANGETEHVVLRNVIFFMRGGKFTEKGYAIQCVPDIRDRNGSLITKKKDCVKLGELFAPKKKNRGSNAGLIQISEKNRYKGKVDWERERTAIGKWINDGASVSKIARWLGVSPSTLSKANKRFDLYRPKQPPCK